MAARVQVCHQAKSFTLAIGKHMEEKKAYFTIKNVTREKQSVKCADAKRRTAIAEDIWELQSRRIELKMEGVGWGRYGWR